MQIRLPQRRRACAQRRGSFGEFTCEEEDRGLCVEADFLQLAHDESVIENDRNEADEIRRPADFQELARALGQDCNPVLLPDVHCKQRIGHPIDASGKFEMGYPLSFKDQTDTAAKELCVTPGYVAKNHIRAQTLELSLLGSGRLLESGNCIRFQAAPPGFVGGGPKPGR